MKRVLQIHYRYLTDADFFNLNKPAGAEDGGGGQTYIDFPTKQIPVDEWARFFDGIIGLLREKVTQGDSWEVPVNSVGLHTPSDVQRVKLYQRRAASISVASQVLNRRSSNRVRAWLPEHGFPQPSAPYARTGQIPDGLCVYLARTADKEIWAGWFLQGAGALTEDEAAGRIVQPMTERSNTQGSTGFIVVGKTDTLLLKPVNSRTPFATSEAGSVTAVVGKEPLSPFPAPKTKTPQYKQRDEEKILDSLFNEDEAPTAPPERRARVQQVRTRNLKAVKDLKALYENRCQISGDKFAFKKTNGQIYCEVHHLIPLGEGGADNPKNMIVVNPLIHRMLHYAEVTGLNLSAIKTNDAGVSTLQIQINGKSYIISWNQDHARRVLEHSP